MGAYIYASDGPLIKISIIANSNNSSDMADTRSLNATFSPYSKEKESQSDPAPTCDSSIRFVPASS